MRIARRLSGGRGEYELPGELNGSRAADLYDREAVIVAPDLQLRTRVAVHEQGGKPRFYRQVQSADRMQIHRQVAALLLMPRPTREETALGTGAPVLRRDEYAIEGIDVGELEIDSQSFKVAPTRVTIKNGQYEEDIEFRLRLSRVRSLWSNAGRFAPTIRALLDAHRTAVVGGGPLTPDIEDLVSQLIAEMGGADPLVLDMVPTALVPPLAAKPFLILTGPAGTGKSRGIIDLATWFDYGAGLSSARAASRESPSTAMTFVPVGADWTDQRSLLGFRNPFGPKRVQHDGAETNLTYQITPLLRLLLRASHPDMTFNPHFVVLDEMNLSHVERYFSTFLSLMEADRSTGEVGQFFLVSREDVDLIGQVLDPSDFPLEAEAAGELVGRGAGLSLPANVYIVGTVNVDETTYMFSPKVLDRAFVHEMPAVPPAEYLVAPSASAGDSAPGRHVLQVFVDDIDNRRRNAGLTDPLAFLRARVLAAGLAQGQADELGSLFQSVLTGTHKLLSPVGFGFGFRAINEAAAYVAADVECRARFGKQSDVVGAVDRAVIMKLLPKIHGNRRRLGESLSALSAFLDGKAAPNAQYALGTAPPVAIEDAEKLGSPLAASAAKAAALHRTLQATGYTTFIS